MKTNEFENQELRAYLLGTASEENAEAMDELSVIDTDFADALGAAEKDLIDAFVQGEMAGSDLKRFEDHYLHSPHRREKVSFARAFQEYAQKNQGDMAVSDAGSKSWIVGFFASLGIFGGAQPAFRFAMAAAALLVVALGGWVIVRNLIGGRSANEVASNINIKEVVPVVQPSFEPAVVETPKADDPEQQPGPKTPPSPTPKPQVAQQARPLIASFVLSPPLRGSNTPSVPIPAATDRAVMRLELESDDFEAYTAVLKEAASGRVIWRSGRLRTAGTGGVRSVSVSIPAKSLKSTVYSITVSGVSPQGEPEIIGDYPFRVVR